MATAVRTLTINDLMRLGSDARVEVVEGDIIEMAPVGGLHSLIAKNIVWALDGYVKEHQLGIVFTDAFLYILSASGEEVRKARVPDASFVRKAAIPQDWDLERPFPGAPTLAVEVMSPDDQFEEVIKKIREYFEAGTEEVWVVLPRQKTVYRYRRGESFVQTYNETDEMEIGTLFPGLTLALSDIFALPKLD